MSTPDDIRVLVHRLHECFNARRFDDATALHAPDFYSHALGATGFQAGRHAWRTVVAQYPDMRVVADDILVDGDKAAVRSRVEGIATEDGTAPMLIEVFRIADGRFAEMWGAATGFPTAAGPADLVNVRA